MPKPKHGVFPQQKRIGEGWKDCPSHRAHAFAVYWQGTLIGRYQHALAASRCMAAQEAAKRKPSRSYTLGARMEKKPDGIGTVVKFSR